MNIHYIGQKCCEGFMKAINIQLQTGREISYNVKDKFYFSSNLDAIILVGDLLPIFDNDKERLYRFLEEAKKKNIPVIGIFRETERPPKGEQGLSKMIMPSNNLPVKEIATKLNDFFYDYKKRKTA